MFVYTRYISFEQVLCNKMWLPHVGGERLPWGFAQRLIPEYRGNYTNPHANYDGLFLLGKISFIMGCQVCQYYLQMLYLYISL